MYLPGFTAIEALLGSIKPQGIGLLGIIYFLVQLFLTIQALELTLLRTGRYWKPYNINLQYLIISMTSRYIYD